MLYIGQLVNASEIVCWVIIVDLIVGNASEIMVFIDTVDWAGRKCFRDNGIYGDSGLNWEEMLQR